MTHPLTIWILQTGEPMPLPGSSGRPMRAMRLLEALQVQGHRVVLWTADFEHMTHSHFTGASTTIKVSANTEIRTIYSRGYSSNISPGRLLDHAQLARNLSILLRHETRPPDVAFVGFPPIEPAHVMARWLSARKVPFLVDVKDQWPEVLLRAFPDFLRPLAQTGLFPYRRMTLRTFKTASGITSISSPFLDWSLSKGQRASSDGEHGVYPLTTSPPDFSDSEILKAKAKWDDSGIVDDGRLRLIFVGTLSSAFDFKPVLSAAKENDQVQFIICGTGSEGDAIKSLFDSQDNVKFPGWVSPSEAFELTRRSDIALAPYHRLPDFQMSLPNKFFDAIASGKPVLTSLSGELARVLTETGSGWSYDPDIPSHMSALVEQLSHNRQLIEVASQAASQAYGLQFSSEFVYSNLVSALERLARS